MSFRSGLFIMRNFEKFKKKMASSSASAAAAAAGDRRMEAVKEIRGHEVAIAEINALSSSRTVYQKNGNLFFRTTTQKALASEQKQLHLAKANLEKLNTS